MSVPATPSGHPVAVWGPLLRAAPVLPLSAAAGSVLLLVAAHPDDETIGVGRLASWWTRHIGPVRAVCLTRGEACVAHLGLDLPDLADRRADEWDRALDRLGVAERIMFRLPDAGLTENTALEALAESGLSRGVTAIAAPWHHDPHPDHRAAGRAAARWARQLTTRPTHSHTSGRVQLWHYPVWMTYWGRPDDVARSGSRLWRVHFDETAERDRDAALSCFDSQLHPLTPQIGPIVPPHMLAHHAGQFLLDTDPLVTLAPAGPPAAIDARHSDDPSVAAATVRSLAAAEDWASLAWPELLAALVRLGRTDVPYARLTEGHVDALRILAEAGASPHSGALYGVWASRSHATGLTARAVPDDPRRWVLDGTLRFASGAGVLDRALVPVWIDPSTSVLLDVAVEQWPHDPSGWRTSAMALSRSHTITLREERVEAERVGADGWYLGRAGFFPGGVGVAAVWAGCGARIVDLTKAATMRAPESPSRMMRLGHMRTDLACALGLVAAAGTRLADIPTSSTDLSPGETQVMLQDLATEVRAGVAGAVMRLVEHARRIAGPAGLAYDEDLTRALHDLDLYLRQQNADADALHLGR